MLTDCLFVNREMRFRGIPDGINMASGELQPLEIKFRTRYQPSDLFELAFYWLLLEPYRLVPQADPVGWLQLADGAGSRTDPIRLDIPAGAFAAVREAAAQARSALADGVDQFWCNCTVCHQYPQSATARRTAPVRVISGIGYRTGAALVAGGVDTVGQLAELSREDIRSALAPSRLRRPSDDTIDGWKEHARVFIANSPKLRSGQHDSLPDRYIAFDVEYQSHAPWVVWLLCAHAVGVESPHRITVFADETEQAALIAEFAGFLAKYPDLPVVTWGGTSADLPALKRAVAHYPMPDSFDAAAFLETLESRHLDLHRWAKKALILPLTRRGVKDAAEYFGLAVDTDVANGLMANSVWSRYRETGDAELKDRLIAYNQSDVTVLASVCAHLKAIHAGSVPPVSAPPQFSRDELISHHMSTQPCAEANDQGGSLRRKLWERLRNRIARGSVPASP
ncbi:ribonuclease H-like domain-containing protein [Prescottella equi]|uniref:ribonuclease H-like domain-containing protein n=1 Tax=Rhodococcus hoagii TaxID=43767 RepID=UPI003D9890D2